jgi:hypothetical protein
MGAGQVRYIPVRCPEVPTMLNDSYLCCVAAKNMDEPLRELYAGCVHGWNIHRHLFCYECSGLTVYCELASSLYRRILNLYLARPLFISVQDGICTSLKDGRDRGRPLLRPGVMGNFVSDPPTLDLFAVFPTLVLSHLMNLKPASIPALRRLLYMSFFI